MNRRARRIIRKAARVRRADGRRFGRVLPRIIVHARACIAAFAALGRAFADITREARRMSEREKCCETCDNETGDGGENCLECGRHAGLTDNWTPKAPPQPAPALLTPTEEFDSWIAYIAGLAAVEEPQEYLRALRPLVEDEECKAAIEAAGCMWTERGQQPWYDHPTADIVVWDRGDPDGAWDSSEARVPTWPEARAWAEAQAAKREEAQWSPEVTDGMWEDDVCERVCDVLAYCHPRGRKDPAWLCGRASAMGRYDHERLRIWLGKGDMPKTT